MQFMKDVITQETIDLLLKKDGNIDQQSINLQQTLLHLAVTQKNIPLVLSLLKKKMPMLT